MRIHCVVGLLFGGDSENDMADIIGDDQPNLLNGTEESDSISGLAADDVMRGSAGANSMDGGIGNDTIHGGEGGDSILGGDGNDVIHGFNSRDNVAGSGNIDAHLIASGLDRPIFGTFAPGDTGRLFIAEQHTGKIKILDLATGQTQQFLDIRTDSSPWATSKACSDWRSIPTTKPMALLCDPHQRKR